MVVVDGPEGREVARVHGGEEVLSPAALQVHEALQALLGVSAHHLQTVRHVRLVENPSEREEQSEGECLYNEVTAFKPNSNSSMKTACNPGDGHDRDE